MGMGNRLILDNLVKLAAAGAVVLALPAASLAPVRRDPPGLISR